LKTQRQKLINAVTALVGQNWQLTNATKSG